MIRRLFPLAVLVACSPSPKADQAPPAEAAALAHTTLDGATASAGVAVAFVCDDSTQVYALFRTDLASLHIQIN